MAERKYFIAVQAAHAKVTPKLSTFPLTLEQRKADRQKIKKSLDWLRTTAQEYTKKGLKSGTQAQVAAEAKWLETEGVNLWNVALQCTRATADVTGDQVEDPLIAAMLRLASLRVIQATSHAIPKEQNGTWLTRILILASETALYMRHNIDVAVTILQEAVEYELRVKELPKDIGDSAQSLMRYYTAQIDIAMVDKNAAMAKLYLNKVSAHVAESNIAYYDLLDLAARCRDAGRILLKSQTDAPECYGWYEAGLNVLAEMTLRYPGIMTPSSQLLQVAILQDLAYAYLSNKDPAIAIQANDVLQQLIYMTDQSNGFHSSLTPQDVRQIKILQVRCIADGPQEEIKDVLSELMGSMEWTEEGVDEMLALINALKESTSKLQAYQSLLDAALSNAEGHIHVFRILHNITKRTAVVTSVMVAEVGKALNSISACPTFIPSQTSDLPGFSTVIIQMGEGLQKQEQWEEAASIYLLAAHPVLSPPNEDNFSRCRRKATLAYINGGDYTKALDMLDGCEQNQATTQYLLFLIAIHQKREIGTLNAIKAILGCPDVNGDLINLMASLALEKGDNTVIQHSVRALLDYLVSVDDPSLRQCAVNVSKYLIKSDLNGLDQAEIGSSARLQAGASFAADCGTVVQLLHADRGLVKADTKGIAWLWKTILQAAQDNQDKLDNSTLADLFNAASLLMQLYSCEDHEADPLLTVRVAGAMYACLCLFLAREIEDAQEKSEAFKLIYDYIPFCQAAVDGVKTSEAKDMVESIQVSLEATKVEALSQAEDWEGLEQAVQAMVETYDDVRMLEAMVDALTGLPDCPANILLDLLDRVISLLSRDTASMGRYARYTHLSIHIMDSQPEMIDRLHTTLERTLVVVRLHGEAYPQDRIQWLYSFCWNKGLKLSHPNPKMGAKYAKLSQDFGMLCHMGDRRRINQTKQHEVMTGQMSRVK